MTPEEQQKAEHRWLGAMLGFSTFLYDQRIQDARITRDGTRLALADLVAAVHAMEHEATACPEMLEGAMQYATVVESLVSDLGFPGVLARIVKLRRSLADRLPAWGHARFQSLLHDVDRMCDANDLVGAFQGAVALRDTAEAAGDTYPEADEDRASARWILGRVLEKSGRAEDAIKALKETRGWFAERAAAGNRVAVHNESAVTADEAKALIELGRFDEAEAAYRDSAARDDAVGNMRGGATARHQLGTVYFHQGRYDEALAVYAESKTAFEVLGEPRSVAAAWHQIGRVLEAQGNLDAAEHACRQSLALEVSQGDRLGEAITLHQLGCVHKARARLDDAASFFRQAADRFRELGSAFHESGSRNALGVMLRLMGRLDEARETVTAAIAITKACGHAAEPWNPWSALWQVERAAGRLADAQNAHRNAITAYRSYRDDGGEPKSSPNQMIAAFGETLLTSGPEAAQELLSEFTEISDEHASSVSALRAIFAGSRDPALAADPSIHPTHAVELALLLESLPPADPPPAHLAADTPCPCKSGLLFHACHGADEPT